MKLPAEPILFAPIHREMVWGGTTLADRFNRPVEAKRRIGESWEIVSHGTSQSVVASGTLAGNTLADLLTRFGNQLVGSIETYGVFPLLVKFIDAADRLSVQVHPSDTQARFAGWGEFGKTECWYVIDAAKDARIITGFCREVTRDEVAAAITAETLPSLLRKVRVSAGDLLFIPAGTVHAILGNTLLYEVQQSSDTTLRLYDWGRTDSAGRPRQLHVHDALSVLDTRFHDRYIIPPLAGDEDHCCLHSWRMACRYFALEEYRFLRTGETILPAKRSFRILTAIEGDLRLRYPSGTCTVSNGSSVMLPAVLREVRAEGEAGTICLVSSVPDLPREVIVPLRESGVSDEFIAGLGGGEEHNDLLPLLAR